MTKLEQELLKACRAAIPCLEDWIRCTGYGEMNRRNRDALAKIRYAVSLAEKRVK